MEVQAHYPSTTAPFIPNYPPRTVARLAGSGRAAVFLNNDAVARLTTLPVTCLPLQQALIGGAAVFSAEQESELTCNASGSRKRDFLDGSLPPTLVQHGLQPRLPKKARLVHLPREVAPEMKAEPATAACSETPSSLLVAHDKARVNDSSMESTSGRLTAEAPGMAPALEQLVSQLCQQSVEVDALIRLQNERIRSAVDDARTRHHRAILSAVEQGVLRRLRDKDAELESASRRNAELEDKIQRLATENQIWFNVARNNEAMVSNLRATLDQVLLHNATAVLGGVPTGGTAILSAQSQLPEGYGDSDCAAPVFPADDAQSCCYEESAPATDAERDTVKARELRLLSVCRVCLKREAAVLLLPCRHVCLCKQCDSGVDACPVCSAVKNASLQVFVC